MIFVIIDVKLIVHLLLLSLERFQVYSTYRCYEVDI